MNPIHVIVKWNPGDAFEPDTIEAHAAILLAGTQRHVWWGKISKSGRIGLTKKHFDLLRQQLRKGIETYLFLYCPDKSPPTLHVARLSDITRSRPLDEDKIPHYYSTVPHPVSHWFKITDLRLLIFQYREELRLIDGAPFDPVSAVAYPALVAQRQLLGLFDYTQTGGRRWVELQALARQGSVGQLVDPEFAFAIMPFARDFDDVWMLGVKPVIESLGLRCSRADDFLHSKDIMEVVRQSIERAILLIADLTGSNPNVFYELGYAHALGKSVILITRDRQDVPFDLRHINNIEYSSVAELRPKLEALARALLKR